MECTDPLGQQVLEELLASGCFFGSGKMFDATGSDEGTLQVLRQLELQGYMAKVFLPGHKLHNRYQFTPQAASLFQARHRLE